MAVLPEWVHRLQHALYHHVIPISFGPPLGPGRVEIRSGTAFLLDLGLKPLLVTAGHVTDDILDALGKSSDTQVFLGNHRVTINAGDVKRAVLDLAAIELTDRLASRLTQDYVIVRPPAWPPPTLSRGDPIVFSGFPGSWRLVSSWADIDFRAFVSLALVHSVSDGEFLCHLDPAYLEQREEPTTTFEPLPERSLGGLSGAPAFLVRNDDRRTLLIPQLCGIVKEGGGSDLLGSGHRLVYFTRLDDLRPDGRM